MAGYARSALDVALRRLKMCAVVPLTAHVMEGGKIGVWKVWGPGWVPKSSVWIPKLRKQVQTDA